jgi:hypothetical protein
VGEASGRTEPLQAFRNERPFGMETLLAATPKGRFPVFTTQIAEDLWAASCLYSESSRMMKVPGEDRNYTFHLHRETGSSRDRVHEAMKSWLSSHFGVEVPLSESSEGKEELFRRIFESSTPTLDFDLSPEK